MLILYEIVNRKKAMINLESSMDESENGTECPVFLDKRSDEFLEVYSMCIFKK